MLVQYSCGYALWSECTEGVVQLESNDTLHLQQPGKNFSLQSKALRFVVKYHLVVLLALLVGASLGLTVSGVHAQGALSSTPRHSQAARMLASGPSNPFPYPSCTWWANQRYHQLHGAYVPWRTQAAAWQWTARAQDFGWRVSNRASQGAIIDLQPGVQGAYGAGHVAVVERVYADGSVLASNASWGGSPYSVTYVHFHLGNGVTFIRR